LGQTYRHARSRPLNAKEGIATLWPDWLLRVRRRQPPGGTQENALAGQAASLNSEWFATTPLKFVSLGRRASELAL